ncbi:hypothetical protein Vadar_004892 [Vaccinium darrowii]|uniref:Uncharacterized protein n=1 Tax=Vaccinium darrowii TaxID=229202 RepID=A0ACB7YJ74_9ERIC|nr:hypothetical protein Vadar_004892 [Vaccinium darrowii]
MLKLIAIQSNGDEEEGDGDEEEGNEIKDNDHSNPYYCFSDLPENTTKENETLLAIGTAFVQGEDVAARGHVLLFSVDRNPDNLQTLVPEVYSKELKGAISALASLQGGHMGRGKILDLGVRILNMKCRVFSVGHDSRFRLQKGIQIASLMFGLNHFHMCSLHLLIQPCRSGIQTTFIWLRAASACLQQYCIHA